MSRLKSVIFNTDMVRATLSNRKTVMRQKVLGEIILNSEMEHKVNFLPYKPRKVRGRKIKSIKYFTLNSFKQKEGPYRPGDILYVREAFCQDYFDSAVAAFRENGLRGNRNAYKADYHSEIVGDVVPEPKWTPSIHMPKEAARIFLRVTDVRVERLQEITNKDAKREGVVCETDNSGMMHRYMFSKLWNSTIKKSDIDRYGWNANPWVWVIEFSKIDKPKTYMMPPDQEERD